MSVTTPNITKKRKDLQNLRAKFELKIQYQTPGSVDPAGNGQRKNDFDNGRPVNNRMYVWDWGGGGSLDITSEVWRCLGNAKKKEN